MKALEFSIYLVAMLLYIWYIVNDKNFKPNPVSFGIWLVVDSVNLITYLDFATNWLAPIVMTFNAAIIFVLSIYRSKQKKISLNQFDWFCIIASMISLLIYFVYEDAEYANVIIQGVLFLGFVPLLRELINTKSSEPLIPWALFCLGYLLTGWITYSNPTHTVIELTYPLVQGFIGCSLVFLVSFINRIRQKKGVLYILKKSSFPIWRRAFNLIKKNN